MIDCQIRRVGTDEVVLVELNGQLDSIGCDQLGSTVEQQLPEDLKRLIIDCQGLDYISSNGLGMVSITFAVVMKRTFERSNGVSR